MEITATAGERCPNCFSPPLSGWRRLTFGIRYERLECEFCGTKLRIPPNYTHSNIKCPHCGTINTIPKN